MGMLKELKRRLSHRKSLHDVNILFTEYLETSEEIYYIRKTLELLEFLILNPNIDFKTNIPFLDLMFYRKCSPLCSFYYYENAYGRHKCSDCPLTHCIRSEGMYEQLENFRATGGTKLMLKEAKRMKVLIKCRVHAIKKEFYLFHRPPLFFSKYKVLKLLEIGG